ncbi:MAG: serine/threonine protein kinase [Phycisphaerae bacterium]|nr:serine/threonine protein kinase [Phycisphaerae bacterium]
MTEAQRYVQAKALFLRASLLPKGDRPGFLRAECGGDTELLERVRRLLSRDESESQFLEHDAVPRAAEELAPGTRLGAFRIVRLLGAGGMGFVYEALEDEPERRVALKLVRRGLGSERLRERFRHEIRVLGQLRHPGIAQIYEAGTLPHAGEQVPYFVMELVEGESLPEAALRLCLRDRLMLLAQLCDAVSHAHQKGVIHRDLKPANILVESFAGQTPPDDSGTVTPFQIKVLDFGVSRAIGSDSGVASLHTGVGQLIGTPAYMSPEQIAGAKDSVDVRSDVYAVGVIACEVLIGRSPYDLVGRTLPEMARIIREQEPMRLGQCDRSLRGDIETIVAKALEKVPDQRYQSAAELAADIRRYLRDEPILARPPSAAYQFRKYAGRHKALIVAAFTALIALTSATIISVWQAGVARRAQRYAESAQELADTAAAAAEREATLATLAGAAAAIASADPITAARILEGTPIRNRGWAWRYWTSRLDESVSLIRVPGRIAAAWMNPEGTECAALTSDGVVYRGSAALESLPEAARLAEAPLRFAGFVNNGRQILTDGPDRRVLTLFDAADGSVIQRHAPLEAFIGFIHASDDGCRVLIGPRRPGRAPGDVLWFLRTPDLGTDWSGDRVSVKAGTTCASITRNGRWAAVGRGIDGIMAWNAESSVPIEVASLPRGAQAIAISENGERIATGGVDTIVRVWDRATGEMVFSLPGHAGTVTALAFDPAGHMLASAAVDLTIRLWDTTQGRAIATLIGQTGPVERVQFIGRTGPAEVLRFSDDGTLLMSASRDGSIRLWRRHPFEKVSVLRGHDGYVYAVSFSTDGSRVFSAAWDGVLRAWDADGGVPLAVADEDHGFITALGRSSDGRMIATGHKFAEPGRPPSIVLWDADTVRPIRTLTSTKGEISDLAFTPDGLRLYVCREAYGIDEFNLADDPPTRHEWRTTVEPDSMAISPDGRELAFGHINGSVSIVSASSGEVMRRWSGHSDRVRGIAFHPTGPLLASASDDGTARLWNLATGDSVELRGHADRVYCVGFSPDGRFLATGSEDTTIAIWDVPGEADYRSTRELTRLRGHEAYVYSLTFSPDGSRLVSGSGDHTVRIWDSRPVHERWRAAARLTGGSRTNDEPPRSHGPDNPE